MPPKQRGAGGGGRGRGRGGGPQGQAGGGGDQGQRAVSRGAPRGGRGGGRGGAQPRGRAVSQARQQGPLREGFPALGADPARQAPAAAHPAVPAAPSAAVSALAALPSPATTPSPRIQSIPSETVADLPPRPEYGTIGRPITLFTNHYRISGIPDIRVYQYALVIPTKDGDQPTKGLARAVWESAELKSALGNYYPNLIFNGRGIAWGPERIQNIPTIEVSRGKSTLPVTFNYSTEFHLSDLTRYITRKGTQNTVEITQSLTFLNQVFSESLNKSPKYMAVGRKYFPAEAAPDEISTLDEFSLLEFRRGFYQTVHWGGTTGLTLNVNITTGIFWNSEMHTILHLALRSIMKRPDEAIALSALNEGQLRIISRNIRNLKFFIKYRGPQKERRVHQATGVSKDTARGKKLNVMGENISIAEYYKRTYNVNLRYPDAPLVRESDILYPMELCFIVPFQRYPQKLEGQQAASMIRFANKTPDLRKKDIDLKMRQLGYQNDPVLKNFNMTVSEQMASVPARILPAPTLLGGKDMEGGSTFGPQSGKWNLRGFRLKNPKSLKRWGILVFDDRRRYQQQGALDRFIQIFCEAAGDCGMQIDRRPVVEFGNFNAPTESIHRECGELYARVQREKGGVPEMLMFVVKGKSSVIYEIVKAFADTICGVPSQVVNGQNVFTKGGDRSYHANLLLKVNTKLGGTTVTLKEPVVPAQWPTMFIGADVSHAAPGSKAPSLATMVGSIDLEGVHYACPLPQNQNNREEVIVGVRSMVTELVTLYKKRNNVFPVRVLYFRDGVAEGQFAKVKEFEVAAIKEAIAEMSGKVPTITAVVVRKRNHTRLFPRDNREADRSSRGNVYPGTVVDREITHPQDYDFYLVSHSSIQGTARPAHHYVIHDEHDLKPNMLQTICYKMSYVYQRSSGSVSLHPAVYYAHLAGNRARAHDPSRDRDDDSTSGGLTSAVGKMSLEPSVMTTLKPLHANLAGTMWWI